jgi:hypothetical protein
MWQFRSSLQPPLSSRGTILRAHLKIGREGGRIVLSHLTPEAVRLDINKYR